jgi:TPR repeat protein
MMALLVTLAAAPLHPMKRLLLIALLLLPTLAAADYQDAIQAYANGRYEEALTEFRRLAAEGDAKALYYVGFFYHNGFGVPKDNAEAAKWFVKAAQKNDAQAQYYMGMLTAKGDGVEKDPVAAHMWYSLSVKNSANERDAAYTQREVVKLEKKMTPEQVVKAKEMAKSFKPQS